MKSECRNLKDTIPGNKESLQGWYIIYPDLLQGFKGRTFDSSGFTLQQRRHYVQLTTGIETHMLRPAAPAACCVPQPLFLKQPTTVPHCTHSFWNSQQPSFIAHTLKQPTTSWTTILHCTHSFWNSQQPSFIAHTLSETANNHPSLHTLFLKLPTTTLHCKHSFWNSQQPSFIAHTPSETANNCPSLQTLLLKQPTIVLHCIHSFCNNSPSSHILFLQQLSFIAYILSATTLPHHIHSLCNNSPSSPTLFLKQPTALLHCTNSFCYRQQLSLHTLSEAANNSHSLHTCFLKQPTTLIHLWTCSLSEMANSPSVLVSTGHKVAAHTRSVGCYLAGSLHDYERKLRVRAAQHTMAGPWGLPDRLRN